MKINKKTELWKKYKILIGLPVVLLFAWALFFYIYKGVIIPVAGTAVTKSNIAVTSEDKYLFTAEDGQFKVCQSFFATTSKLTGLAVTVMPKAGGVDRLEAHVLLVDGITKEPVFNKDIVLEDIYGPKNLSIIFDEQLENTKDRYFEMVIDFAGDGADDIALVGTSNEQYEYLECQINEVSVPQGIGLEQYIEYGHFIINIYKIFVVLFSAFIILFYVGLLVKRLKIENLYLMTVLALGFFYCFVFVPFSVPDESMHASTVYRITNDILGIEETGDENTIYKRVDDAAVELNNDCNLNQYYITYNELFKKVENEELYETGYRDTGVTPFMYAPAVVGVLIGRLVGLGPVPMYMLARILMLIFFAVMTYAAMKKLPFGKTALFIICVMPMTLQQAASMSYDAVVMAVTILFTATSFQMAFGEERIRLENIIVTVILGILLIFAKSGAYLPLIILLAMIPVSKLGGAKKKWIVLGGFAVALVAVFMFKSLLFLEGSDGGAVVSGAAEEGYSLSYILQNPGVIFNVGIGTFLMKSGYYISTMIGSQLSFLNVYINEIVVFIFLILMVLSSAKLENEKQYLTAKNKVQMVFSVLGSIGLVLLSMWLFITPISSGMIEGVQGRYFIPILWVIIMLFRNKTIVMRKDISRGLIFVAVITHILVFVYIFRDIFFTA